MRNRAFNKRTILWLLALCCLLIAPAKALAAKTIYPAIYVESGEGETRQRVGLWEYGTNVRFFLPSGFDTEHMTLVCGDKVGSVTIDSRTYHSGDALRLDDVFGAHTLRYGRQKYTLTIMRSANLPSMFLTTESGSLDYVHKNKHNKEAGTFRLFDETGALTLSDDLEHIKGRGNSTFGQPKRPYQIKFEHRVSLFGLPAAKRWLLLANHKEKSLIRNSVMFEAARRLGERYPNHDQYLDLYINDQYLGTYELCEKVEVDKNRIGIRDLQEATEALNDQPLDSYKRFGSSQARESTVKGFKIPNAPEDITGGYLLVLEKAYHYAENFSGIVTKRKVCFIAKSPENLSEKQAAYISKEIQRLENAIYAKDGRDPETGKHFSELADMDSMVREYLLEEVLKNYDVNRSSQYIVKPSDDESSLLYFGPAWDFDLSMGSWCDNASNSHIASPKRMLASTTNGWLAKLYQHRVFYEQALTMYYEEMVPYLRALTGLEPDGTTVPLMERYEQLKASAAMNFTRWPILNTVVPVNTGLTYQANIEYLNNWLIKRMEYLDTVWLKDYQAIRQQ